MGARTALDNLNYAFAKRFGFTARARLAVYRKLAWLLDNGVTLDAALDEIASRRARRKGARDVVVVALRDWSHGIAQGRPFAAACESWVPESEAMLIYAGERGSDLAHGLRKVAELITAKTRIRGALYKGLTYPCFLVLIFFGASYLFGARVFPQFTAMVPSANFTGWAAAGIAYSEFVVNWLWLMAVLVIAVVVAVTMSLPRWSGAGRSTADRFPPYSLYRVVNGSVFLISLAAMVEAGSRVDNAISALKRRQPKWLRSRLDNAQRHLTQGANLGEAFERAGRGFPDPEIIDDLSVLADQGGFDEALARIGKTWQDEAVARVQRGALFLFTWIILVVALLIAFLVGATFDLQTQLADVIKR